jgi:hypothetical protein
VVQIPRWVFFPLAAALTFFASGSNLRVFVAALILAFAVRLVYVLVRRRSLRPLLSGWIFVIALGLLVTVLAGSHSRRMGRANAAALRQGVVARKADAKPRDRCVGLLLDWWDDDGWEKNRGLGISKEYFRGFVSRLCRRAALDGVLHDEGWIDKDAFLPLWYSGSTELRDP